jgi:predicted MFS family arabinose efflux permease
VTFAPSAAVLFLLLFVLGAACSIIQVLVPAAAAMTEPEYRGRVIGDIMSGLMVGILLSRPIGSFLAGTWGWKAFFFASAAAMTVLALTLSVRLSPRQPTKSSSYGSLIASMWHLFITEPVLRGRSITAAIVMAAFNFFWTTIVYLLSAGPFNLGQQGIGLFALVGAGGAIVTPLIGRCSDRGLGKRVTIVAHIILMLGFGVAAFSGLVTTVPTSAMFIGLGLTVLMLDMGVLGDQTVGRYFINLLRPEARGRINGIFVGVFFIGGAIGSALSGMLWAWNGWAAVCGGGALLSLLALVLHALCSSRWDIQKSVSSAATSLLTTAHGDLVTNSSPIPEFGMTGHLKPSNS